MALDLDLDGSFNDDDEEFESAQDFGDDFDSDDEGEDENEPRRRNPLRLILLALLVLALLCVVCYLGASRLPDSIAGLIPGFGGSQPTPVAQTSEPAPTDEATSPATEEVPPEATDETQPPTPTTEATDVSQLPEQPTEEPTAVEPTQEPGIEPTEETPQPTTTVVVVPGPTATLIPTSEPQPTDEAMPTTEATTEPGPTVVITPESCDGNIPPVADAGGPYNAMRGKGQAIVTFDGSGSVDSDGIIVSYEWDFGDNSATESGETVTHGYTSVGSYVATLTVTDDCGAIGQDTADVTIVGPTPPAGTGTPTTTTTPTPTPTPYASTQGTLGFCYRVNYGDTLSGIAWRFGVTWSDLAYVNNVPMNYYVIAGQGLFIPTGEIIDGPNLYQVESGDTLNSVAFQCGLLTADLAQVNGLDINASLSPGQLLMIPPWNYIKYY